jgi:hypothetical protein
VTTEHENLADMHSDIAAAVAQLSDQEVVPPGHEGTAAEPAPVPDELPTPAGHRRDAQGRFARSEPEHQADKPPSAETLDAAEAPPPA